MFTKNWYILQGLNMLADEQRRLVKLRAPEWNGNDSSWYYYYPLRRDINIHLALNSVKTNLTTISDGVLFGTGDTPASLDDYKLAGDVITNIAASINRTYSYFVEQQSLKAVYTITNNNTEEITIREVALNVAVPHAISGGKNQYIIDRTVLDTPVTIPSGGVGQVEYTITFNLPTATA